jgi:hypothetical protein
MMADLDQLLNKVDALFGHVPTRRNETYNYSLGRFPSGWNFHVTNDWHKWMDRSLPYKFGLYGTPAAAVQAFLDYVEANSVNVQELTEV